VYSEASEGLADEGVVVVELNEGSEEVSKDIGCAVF